MLHFILVCFAYLIATISDIRTQEIPNLCHGILISAAAVAVGMEGQSWVPRVVGFLVVGIFTLVVGITAGGLGGGDIKLLACTALALGFLPTVYILLLGLLPALITLIIQSKKSKTKKAIPLAPFLSIGMIAFFFIDKFIIPSIGGNLYGTFG